MTCSARLLQGNEACALAGVDAGARFYAGYPISPASEIAEMCSQILPQHGGIYVQMEDEIGSIAAVIGASLGGLKAFTATSGPGLSLMQENIGFALMAEVPCVIINVQRFGPSTGIATRPSQGDVMAARWGTHGDHSIIVLSPSSVQECYDLTVEAFNLAERFRAPVIVLTDATIAHLREKIEIPDELKLVERLKPEGPVENYRPFAPGAGGVPVIPNYGDKYILRVTGLVHDEEGYPSADPQVAGQLIERLAAKIERFRDELPQPLFYGEENAKVVLVSYGISARAAKQAVSIAVNEKLSVGMLQLQTLWPFPEEQVKKACAAAEAVLVIEMNRGQIMERVKACGLFPPRRISSVSRTDTGIITPTQVLTAIRGVAG